MHPTLIKNSELLRALTKLGIKERVALLKIVGDKEIHCLCECIYNTLKGKVPLTQTQKKGLSRHKVTLRRIVKPKESIHKKRKLLVQKGGSLLPLILSPIITGLLGKLFN